MGTIKDVWDSTYEHGVNNNGKQDLLCLCGAPSPLMKDLSFRVVTAEKLWCGFFTASTS